LPVNYVGLLLILLGTVFYVLEIKVTSYGALSVGGVISLFLGSVILIKAPIPELRPSLKFIIPVVLGISLIFVMLVYLVIKAHSRRSLTGKEGMIGELGQALSPFSPDGKIFVHGEIWRAVSDDRIDKGDKVQVVEVQDHLTLKVKKV
jgi:membrane-bound serine protease (ClpP class)